MTTDELKVLIRECIEEVVEESNYEEFSPTDSVLEDTQMIAEGIEAGNIYIVNEKVKFSFLPKLKQEKDTKRLWGAAAEAEKILNSSGEDVTASILYKIGGLILRIWDIFENIGSAIALPFCITIIGIPGYLLIRLWSYALRLGEQTIALEYSRKALVKVNKLIAAEKDAKKKALLEAQRDKIQRAIDKAQKGGDKKKEEED